MKAQIKKWFSIFFAASIFAGIIVLIFEWPGETIFGLIVLGMVISHWEAAIMITTISITSCMGGFVMIWLIHLIFTGQFLINLHDGMWGIGMLCTCIYSFGIIINEDQQKPYIWLWRNIIKLGQWIIKLAKANKLAIG